MKRKKRPWRRFKPPYYAEEGWSDKFCYEPSCGTPLLWWLETEEVLTYVLSGEVELEPDMLTVHQPGLATIEFALIERSCGICEEDWLDYLEEQQLYYERSLV